MKRFRTSERVYVSKQFALSDLSSYNQPPLTASGWLLICDNNLPPYLLSSLNKLPKNNIILFCVTNKKQLNSLLVTLDSLSIDVKVVDNLIPPENKVVKYIEENVSLSLDEDNIAEYLYERYQGYMPDIVTTVYNLRPFNNVTKSMIREYGVQRNKYAIFNLAEYLIGAPARIDYKSAVGIIYDYQYNFQYLVKYLQEYVQQYIDVFTDIESGKLVAKTLNSYKPPKSLSNAHQYQIKKMFDNYQFVSFGKLLWLRCKLANITGSTFSMIRLVSLISLEKDNK